jgi:hypothetical protein
MQSTLEPLSVGVRLAIDTGNNDFVFPNCIYYLLRSFSSGKPIKELIDEVFVCVRFIGNHLGNDSSFKTPSFKLFLQFFFTPLYNVLHEFENIADSSDCHETLFPFDEVQLMDNRHVLTAAIELERFNFIMIILGVQVCCEFMFRSMEAALKYSNMYFEHFIVSQTEGYSSLLFNPSFTHIMNYVDFLI